MTGSDDAAGDRDLRVLAAAAGLDERLADAFARLARSDDGHRLPADASAPVDAAGAFFSAFADAYARRLERTRAQEKPMEAAVERLTDWS